MPNVIFDDSKAYYSVDAVEADINREKARIEQNKAQFELELQNDDENLRAVAQKRVARETERLAQLELIRAKVRPAPGRNPN